MKKFVLSLIGDFLVIFAALIVFQLWRGECPTEIIVREYHRYLTPEDHRRIEYAIKTMRDERAKIRAALDGAFPSDGFLPPDSPQLQCLEVLRGHFERTVSGLDVGIAELKRIIQ